MNLDVTNIYMTLAALFIAQAYGIHLSLGDKILLPLARGLRRNFLALRHVEAVTRRFHPCDALGGPRRAAVREQGNV